MTETKTITFEKVKHLSFYNSSDLTCVIVNGGLHRWVGISFVNEGTATDAQKLEYPTVVD